MLNKEYSIIIKSIILGIDNNYDVKIELSKKRKATFSTISKQNYGNKIKWLKERGIISIIDSKSKRKRGYHKEFYKIHFSSIVNLLLENEHFLLPYYNGFKNIDKKLFKPKLKILSNYVEKFLMVTYTNARETPLLYDIFLAMINRYGLETEAQMMILYANKTIRNKVIKRYNIDKTPKVKFKGTKQEEYSKFIIEFIDKILNGIHEEVRRKERTKKSKYVTYTELVFGFLCYLKTKEKLGYAELLNSFVPLNF